MRYPLLWLSIALLIVAGCTGSDGSGTESGGAKTENGTEASQNGTEAQGTAAQSSAAGNKNQPASKYGGRWLVIVSPTDALIDLPIAVIEVRQDKQGKPSATVIDSSPEAFPNASVTDIVLSKQGIELKFSVKNEEQGFEGELTYTGALDGEVIRGSAMMQDYEPVRLVRTDDKKLKSAKPEPAHGAEDFEAALKGSEQIERLRKVVKKFPDSPVAIVAHQVLLDLSVRNKLEENVVGEAVADFMQTVERWGPNIADRRRLAAAMMLVRQKHLPELALKVLKPLEKDRLADEGDDFQSYVRVTKALAQIYSADKQTRAAGGATLKELHQQNFFDHRFRVPLAEYSEAAGDVDEAIRLHGELAVLPGGEGSFAAARAGDDQNGERGGETAAQAAERLWEKKHGNTDGLQAYLDKTYEASIHRVSADAATAPAADAAGTRVSLLELFTSTSCPPCVAINVAVAGVEATYPSSSLVALRYHVPSPPPDPLANAYSETRMFYYEQGKTPTLMLNGKEVDNVGGYLLHSQQRYQQLREAIDPLIHTEGPLAIRLSADAKGDRLTLSADVENANKLPGKARLRLVLAEELVDFDARNGVRKHEMVVRHMPGGPDGVAPKEGRLEFSTTIPLRIIRQELTDYLDRLEKQSRQPLAFTPAAPARMFPVRPMDLKQLHLVAFVQDDATQKILQAAAIPVSGELEVPGESSEQPAAADNDAPRPVEAPLPGPKLVAPGE